MTAGRLLRRSVPRLGGRAPGRVFDEAAVMAELERRYDLGSWQSWRRTDAGRSNDSYYVDVGRGRYVLRRSSEVKTPAAAEFECALLDHLVAAGYPAPPVVRSRDGACLVEVDGLVHMLMGRLDGATYDHAPSGGLPAAATGLGRYHRLVLSLGADVTPEEVSTPAALRRGTWALRAVLDVAGPLLDREARRLLGAQLGELEADVRRVGAVFEEQPHLTYLVTHGSYGRTAVLLDGGRLTGVVDFDRAVHDFLVLDLAYALKSFARPARGTGAVIDLELGAAFLRHYASERALGAADAAALPWALRLQRLAVVSKKCTNVLTKHALLPRGAEEASQLARLVSREADRLRWLSLHHDDLARVVATAATTTSDRDQFRPPTSTGEQR